MHSDPTDTVLRNQDHDHADSAVPSVVRFLLRSPSLGVEWGGAAALALAAAVLLFVRPSSQAKPEPVSARS